MDKYLKGYIDNNIIREFVYKGRDGYSLNASDIDGHDAETLVSILFNHDPATKDILLDRIQELIDERLPVIESEDKYSSGLKPVYDKQNGEVRWVAYDR